MRLCLSGSGGSEERGALSPVLSAPFVGTVAVKTGFVRFVNRMNVAGFAGQYVTVP